MEIAGGKMVNEEYIARINKVQDYIDENIGEEFSLSTLAQVANFSPYHFHRIFSTYTGESLHKYILRIRLEKAAGMLMNNRTKPIIEVAIDCGFSNQSSFARVFKQHFGVSAGEYRKKTGIYDSKDCKTDRKECQMLSEDNVYNGFSAEERVTTVSDVLLPLDLKVKEVESMNVVYIRHVGPYKNDEALFTRLFTKLHRWASARDLVNLPDTKWLTIYHNEPEVTRGEKLRISVSVTVPFNAVPSGEIGTMTVHGGKYVIARFSLMSHQYQAAWDYLFRSWLPESGYQPDDKPSFELFPAQEPGEDGSRLVDIYLPVKPM